MTDGQHDPGTEIWLLALNDMRSSNMENLTFVCWSSSMDDLRKFLEYEQVTSYWDGSWGKSFRKFGPLEWYNPPWNLEEGGHFILVPPVCTIHGVVEYRHPMIVNLPSVQVLEETSKRERALHPPTIFERVTWGLTE